MPSGGPRDAFFKSNQTKERQLGSPKMSDKILTAEAVIKAKDATGGTFTAIAGKIAGLARAANALNRDVEKQIATANRAASQASRMTRATSAIGGGLRTAAGAAAAYEGSNLARQLVERTAKATADRQHEITRQVASGMTPGEIDDAGKLAADLSAKYKPLSETSLLHTTRNIRAVVGTFEEAAKIADPLAKLRVVAEGAHPDKAEELESDFDALTKGMEIKGVTQNLPKFVHYMDGMAKALNVFGDTLRPTDYYEMFKYGRAATTALSDDFMLKTAPTLAQELGGSSTGKALSSFYTQFVGGKMSNLALKQLLQYGMVDPSKVEMTKTGNVKGVLPGGIVGSEYLQPGKTDPYEWTNKVLLPHLAAKGITDPAKIQEVIAALSSQTTTAQMLSIFATQQARIAKDQHLVAGAQGLEAADTFMSNDPKVMQKALTSQIDNVLANSGKGAWPVAKLGMGWGASALSYMSDRSRQNPVRGISELGWLATVAGSLGLAGAGASLDWVGSKVTGRAFGGLKFGAGRMLGELLPFIEWATHVDVLPASSLGARYGALQGDKGWRNMQELQGLSDQDRIIDRTDFGDETGDYARDLHAKLATRRAALEGELSDLGYAGPNVPGRGLQTGLTTEAIREALYPAGGQQQPVEAKVTGEATLKTEVVVEPSPDFLARVKQTVDNRINAFREGGAPATGSSGSSGRSMPEATAPM